jgi:hypothetical protein
MAAVATVSSASGLLTVLQELTAKMKLHALASLNFVVHLFWPEISTSVLTDLLFRGGAVVGTGGPQLQRRGTGG